MKLTDLDPHFIRHAAVPHEFDHTNKLSHAEGIQMKCPACYWSSHRRGKDIDVHELIIWKDPKAWQFVGHDYRDVSAMAGRISVMLTAGGCRTRFMIKHGKVDFV